MCLTRRTKIVFIVLVIIAIFVLISSISMGVISSQTIIKMRVAKLQHWHKMVISYKAKRNNIPHTLREACQAELSDTQHAIFASMLFMGKDLFGNGPADMIELQNLDRLDDVAEHELLLCGERWYIIEKGYNQSWNDKHSRLLIDDGGNLFIMNKLKAVN